MNAIALFIVTALRLSVQGIYVSLKRTERELLLKDWHRR